MHHNRIHLRNSRIEETQSMTGGKSGERPCGLRGVTFPASPHVHRPESSLNPGLSAFLQGPPYTDKTDQIPGLRPAHSTPGRALFRGAPGVGLNAPTLASRDSFS